MNRRQIMLRVGATFGTIGLAWLGVRRHEETKGNPSQRTSPASPGPPRQVERGSAPLNPTSPFDRVMFVCVDDRGEFGPGVYLHGPDGGGPACLSFAAEAAHSMRTGEVSDSTAGLCGHLFTRLGPEVTSGGGLSLVDSPKPNGSKVVDWQDYCGWNVDLILINVDRHSAECFVSSQGEKGASKLLVARLDGLKFGG